MQDTDELRFLWNLKSHDFTCLKNETTIELEKIVETVWKGEHCKYQQKVITELGISSNFWNLLFMKKKNTLCKNV